MSDDRPIPGGQQRLQWIRSARLCLRRGGATQISTILRWLLPAWTDVEVCSDTLDPTHIIELDGEIVGLTTLGRGVFTGLTETDELPPRRIGADELFSIEPTGTWAIKAGTVLDERLVEGMKFESHRHIFEQIAPLQGALYADRHGLQGYFAALPLLNWTTYRSALTPAAYVQQIEAGAIAAEPLLMAHLLYGARLHTLFSSTRPPIAVVHWQRR